MASINTPNIDYLKRVINDHKNKNTPAKKIKVNPEMYGLLISELLKTTGTITANQVKVSDVPIDIDEGLPSEKIQIIH